LAHALGVEHCLVHVARAIVSLFRLLCGIALRTFTMVQQNITVFRDYAARLATQLVEQMTAEYAREVQALWNDVLMYRHELERVAALLGSQLEREKKLHGVIEQLMGHSTNAHQQAQAMAQQRLSSDQLHQLLDQHLSAQQEALNHTAGHLGHANQAMSQHYANAQQWKEPMISTENEFVRIMELLKVPPVPPAPALASGTSGIATPPVGPYLPPGPGVLTQTTSYAPPAVGALTPSTPRPTVWPLPQHSPQTVMVVTQPAPPPVPGQLALGPPIGSPVRPLGPPMYN